MALTSNDNAVHYVEKMLPPLKFKIHYSQGGSEYDFSPRQVVADSEGKYVITQEDLNFPPDLPSGWFGKDGNPFYSWKVGDTITSDTWWDNQPA